MDVVQQDRIEETRPPILLSDAVDALSKIAKEEIKEKTLLQLAREKKLTLLWHLENRLVRKVEPLCTLKKTLSSAISSH